LESPGKDGKMWCNRMLPDFVVVAFGSWPLMIVNFGGKIVEAKARFGL
jgi:hypothetical protein